ncbi:hypothetical protein BRD10_02620 [Halobacteriales archaeon SW_12_71_31]|nr:MAG: hypothetical protein BRD10_02620 [Halobacteriales archaeon SW_12_71_31]
MSKTPTPADGASLDDDVRGIQFETADTGITVVDGIERKRDHLGTDPVVEPTPVPTDRLVAPVDSAVRLYADRVEADPNIVMVRDDSFDMVDHLTEGTEREYPPGRYVVDVSGPIKQYLQVDGRLSISTDEGTVIEVGDGAEALLGARSKHNRPATEITVPPTTDGLVRAVSTFGAALKMTTPDRSWPGHRGHPPAVTVGDELDVPQGLAPPCPEVQVLVPPEERYVYPVAPLVYYLGAELVPHRGPPQIRTDAGFEYDLQRSGEEFETRVEQTLKQVLFLECCLRSEGLIELPLHERSAVAGDLPMNAAELFDQPAQVRLPAYLSVEHETIAPHIPDWELAAHLAPRPEQAELLPHLVNDLAVVRTTTEDEGDGGGVDPTELSTPEPTVDEAVTDDAAPEEGDASFEDFFRSAGTDIGDGWTVENSVDLRDDGSDALETVWSGEGVPVGASKATKRAYENRYSRQPDPPPIDVGVVCNDDSMSEELDVTELYDGEKLPMNVSTYRNLSRAGLKTLVEAGDVDFLHYIGHAEPDGLHCADGTLSFAEIDGTETEAFLLNACRSFDQGRALIEAGAIGGVVTLQPVPIESAAEVGKRVAELLNIGYPLGVAVDVADEATQIGSQYQIVGDGGRAVAQHKSGGAFVHEVTPVDGDLSSASEYDLRIQGHPGENNGLGGVFHPHHDEFGHYLIGNSTPEVRLEQETLVGFLRKSSEPVIVQPNGSTDSNLWTSDRLAEQL